MEVLQAVNLDWTPTGYTAYYQVGSHLLHLMVCQIDFSNKHGRWKSDWEKDRYIKDRLESLLSVPKKFSNMIFLPRIAFNFRYMRIRLYYQKVFVFSYSHTC